MHIHLHVFSIVCCFTSHIGWLRVLGLRSPAPTPQEPAAGWGRGQGRRGGVHSTTPLLHTIRHY